MRIGVLDLDHAVPGETLVVEKYYVQRTLLGDDQWADALIEANLHGIATLGQAQLALIRARNNYCEDVGWRIIKRTCAVTTEVAMEGL